MTEPDSRGALARLIAERDDLNRKLQAYERAIQALRDLDSQLEDEVPIRPDEFAHMDVRDAIVKYLYKIKRPAHIEREVLPALLRGGCRPARNALDLKDRHHLRTVKTTATMNSKPGNASHPFTYDEHNGTLRLRVFDRSNPTPAPRQSSQEPTTAQNNNAG